MLNLVAPALANTLKQGTLGSIVSYFNFGSYSAKTEASILQYVIANLSSDNCTVELHYSRKMVDANVSTILDFCVFKEIAYVEKAGYIRAVYFYT